MRKTLTVALASLWALVALGQALDVDIQVSPVGGVRKTFVSPANLAPVWSATVPASTQFFEDTATALNLIQYCSDPDGATPTITLQSGANPTGMAVASGSLFGTPTTIQTVHPVYRCSDGDLFDDTTIDIDVIAIPGNGSTCATLTCGPLGTAVGVMTEVSPSSITFAASGPSDEGDIDVAYKSYTSGDIQFCARIPGSATWTGHLEAFTGFGVGIRESTASSSYFAHTWIPYGDSIPRSKSGTPGTTTASQAPAAISGAVTLCKTYDLSATLLQSWYSTNGVNFTQIGTGVPKTLTFPVLGYVFGTPLEVGVTTTATIDNIVEGRTITVAGGGGSGNCIAPFGSPTNDTYGAGFGLTADEDCRSGNDIVKGWDFSVADNTPVAARSGIFNGNTAVPHKGADIYYHGKRLYQCNLQWDELEPTEGNFNWSSANACFPPPNGYDGVLLNVRGAVAKIRNGANSADKYKSEWSAPAWVIALAPLRDEGPHTGDFRVFNLNLDNPTVKAKYLNFIAAFAAQSYEEQDMWQVLHVASTSRGEECCAGASPATVTAICNAWATPYNTGAGDSDTYKIAWMREDPDTAFEACVDDGGTGARGGIIENWLRTVYTPGAADKTGQLLDGEGHLSIEPTFKPISEIRHWMDEMEEINGSSGKFPDPQGRMYIAAGLRSMQMRRNIMWTDGNSVNNPRLDDWMSLQMGKTAATDSEGFAFLMETSTYSNGVKTIHNFERHIVQPEALGATTPTNNVAHGYNATGNDQLVSSEWDMRYSRRENNASDRIGFAVEDAFWPTNQTSNCIYKVGYVDSGSAAVRITDELGATRASFTTGTSGELRTASRFVTGCTAHGVGNALDFSLETDPGSPVDFVYVRLIKEGGSFPTWQ